MPRSWKPSKSRWRRWVAGAAAQSRTRGARAGVRVLLLAAGLALASYGISWLLFGTPSYAGERADDVFIELARTHLWLAIGHQLELLALHVVVYLALLLLAEGAVRGLEVTRGRPLRHPWRWRGGLALLFNVLVMLEAMALYPALFEGHFYQAGGLPRSIQEMAVGLGPYWLAPLVLPLAGHVLHLGKRFGRTKLLGVVALVLAVVGGVHQLLFRHSSAALPTGGRPNLLVLACDSLRGDKITAATTPTLLALSDNGVFIPDLRISVARTETAWTSLLSGQWPLQHGIRHMFPTQAEVAQPFPSVFRALSAAGYRTLVVGDLGSEQFADMDFGFAEREVPRFDASSLLQGRFLMSQPLLLAYAALPFVDHAFPAIRLEPTYNNAANVTRRLLDELDEQPAGKPFAVLAIYSAAHFPYAATYPYYQRLPPDDGRHRFSKRELLFEQTVSAPVIARTHALYDAATSMFDHEVAQVLAYLERRAARQRTVIMVMGDHGEELYEDGQTMAHGDHLFGRSNRTPLIVSGPNIVDLEAPVQARLRDVDLAPTLAELLSVPGRWQGASFASLLTAGTEPRDRDMYYETGLWFTAHGNASWQRRRLRYPDITTTCHIDEAGRVALQDRFRDVVISAKHRALETAQGRIVYMPTLYGAEWSYFPPGEDRDRIADPRHRQTVATLQQQLEQLTTSMGEPWIAGRVLARTKPDGSEAEGPWSCTLRLHHAAEETDPARYRGAFQMPPSVTPSHRTSPMVIDVVLSPGQEHERWFWPTAQLDSAQLSLSLDGTPLTGADLFTGSLNIQPFDDLQLLELQACQAAIYDHGGYREPTAIWLGCRRHRSGD